MAFTTLEERYNSVSQQIYNRFTPSPDQLLVVKPNTRNRIFGSNSRIKDDSRLLPLVSTARDFRRISKLLDPRQPKGRLLLGTQLLLQTGNTFVETRIYDPTEIIVNTGLIGLGQHTKRHLSSTTENRGGLQPGTITRLIDSNINVSSTKLDPKLTFLRPEFAGYSLNEEEKKQVLTEGNRTVSVNPRVLNVQGLSLRGTKKTLNVLDVFSQKIGTPNEVSLTLQDVYTKYTKQLGISGSVEVSKTFTALEKTLNSNGYYEGNTVNLDGPFGTPNDVTTFKQVLRDPLNTFTKVASDTITPDIYSKISGDPKTDVGNGGLSTYQTNKPDIITFSFTTNLRDAKPVHFRAFLSSFKQNVKPSFNEQQYVGRAERFVTYGGARRTANLQFNIAAFSQSEIKEAWARVNYLTGLAFPLDFSTSGFMVPPLFRLTLGNIYKDQPCYIDNIDFDFLDESITFDIDNEVSQVINVNMSIILLEKSSRFYDSPFYKILEPSTT